jgi:hypothetical protein
MKGERLITISYIAGEGIKCDVEDCEEEASYMGGGKTQCTEHWTSQKDDE